MAKDCSESAPNLNGNVDVDKVREAVRRWRQAFKDLGFEHQRQRDELVQLAMQERLCEDNEKLLRHENALLKAALAGCAEAPGAVKRLLAENEALREDLDDARASLCAGALEHEAKLAELRSQLAAERRGREQAQRALDAEATARAALDAQLEERTQEGRRLGDQLAACREQLKAREQEYRCQLIAAKLERDEQVMRLEGRLQRLQTSGHDLCRQQYAALQQELAQARAELGRLQKTPPGQQSPAGRGKERARGGAVQSDGGTLGTLAAELAGEETGVPCGETPTRGSFTEAPKAASDGTVDSTRCSNPLTDSRGTPTKRVAAKSPRANSAVAVGPLRVSELLARSRRPKEATAGDEDEDGDIVDESDPDGEDVAAGDSDLSALGTPPLASEIPARQKKRRLLLEVDDMLFVENE